MKTVISIPPRSSSSSDLSERIEMEAVRNLVLLNYIKRKLVTNNEYYLVATGFSLWNEKQSRAS